MFKKIFLFMFIFLLLIGGTIYAVNPEGKTKIYDENNKKISYYENSEKYGEATLLTPINNRVGAGKEVLVAKINFQGYKDINSFFSNIELYNLNNKNSTVDRVIKLKYLTLETQSQRVCYTSCQEFDNNITNQSPICDLNCNNINKNVEVWNDMNFKKNLKKENLTVGIFTEVNKGDKIEWIPTLFDIRSPEWASWEESLETGLMTWWKMNMSTGQNALESVTGQYNFTTRGGATYNPGKIANASRVTILGPLGLPPPLDDPGAFDLSTSNVTSPFRIENKSFAISMWVNHSTNCSGDYCPFISSSSTWQDLVGLSVYVSNSQLCGAVSSGCPIPCASTSLGDSKFHHVVFMRNQDPSGEDYNISLWVDGTTRGSGTCRYNASSNAQNKWWIGNATNNAGGVPKSIDATIDEVGFWNRSLTASEILTLNDSVTYAPDSNPIVTLNSPINNFNSSNIPVTFNCSVVDDIGLSNLSLYLDGVRNLTIDSNNSIFTGFQSTINLAESYHNWTCIAYDNSSQVNIPANRTIAVDTIKPSPKILFPSNNTAYPNNQTELNISVIDIGVGLSSCWWSNDSGITNVSITCGNNVTGMNSTKGNNYWRLYANDSAGNQNYTQSFFYVDITNPNVSINTPQGNQTTLSINISINASDDRNLSYCFYNVTRGSSTEITNTAVNLINFTEQNSVSTYYTYYNLWVTCNDTVNNINITNSSFDTIFVIPPSNGGGGGGGENTVDVIALKTPKNYTIEMQNLQRAIIYARMREYCINFSSLDSSCVLSDSIKLNLINEISKDTLDLEISQLEMWLKAYNNLEIENIRIGETNAKNLRLYISNIEIVKNPFQIMGVLDKFWIITTENSTSFSIVPNKIVKSCIILEGENWECNSLGTSINLKYTLPKSPPDFSAKILKVNFVLKSEDGDVTSKEMQIRAFNLRSPLIISILVSIPIIFILIFKFRRQTVKFIKNIVYRVKRVFKRWINMQK